MIIEVNLSKDIVFIEEEILNEVNFYNTRGREKYFIALDASEKHTEALLKDPYMKIYKGKSFKESTHETRLSLEDASYIEHTNSNGKKNLKINKEVKDWITESLQKNSTLREYKNLSVWDAIWSYINTRLKEYNQPPKYVKLDKFLEKLYGNSYE